MPWLSKEQIEQARSVDLLSYLTATEPRELRRTGRNEYRTATHSSLVISKGKWVWNKMGFGGTNAIDYLVRVRGMSFVEAAEAVLKSGAAPSFPALHGMGREPPIPAYCFHPPVPEQFPALAVAYLQRRGISPEVIGDALQKGVLYESRYYNPAASTIIHRYVSLPVRTRMVT